MATTMQMCYVGLQNTGGPLGVFLFVGPSGVGKTELAKALAAQLFVRFPNRFLAFLTDEKQEASWKALDRSS